MDWGNDDAPTLLLLHGIHDHCHSWDWLAPHFASRFHIVAPDLRGHGDSEWTTGSSYAYTEYVYDILQLVEQRRLAPITLIAHSLGGTIASIFAGVYPELVERLVLIEGVGLYPRYTESASKKIANWVKANVALAGRTPRRYPELTSAYRRMHEANQHLSESQAHHLTVHGSHQNEDGTFSWKFDNYTRLPSPYDIPNDEIETVWQNVRCPTLIINSEQGYPHRIGQDGTDKHFARLEMCAIQNAGHWAHHDELGTVVEHINEFFDSASTAGRGQDS